MEKQRHVESLMSVFNLNLHEHLKLNDRLSTRIMLLYDRKEDRIEFRLLDKTLTTRLSTKIQSWLEENIQISDIASGFNANFLENKIPSKSS
jgi:hypothetical protein